jgi:hypothetical protein
MSLLAQAEQFFAALDGHNLDEVVAAIAPSANIPTPIGSFRLTTFVFHSRQIILKTV